MLETNHNLLLLISCYISGTRCIGSYRAKYEQKFPIETYIYT